MKELQRYQLHDMPEHGRSMLVCDNNGSWCKAGEAIAALESAEAREAELRAEVERLRGMVTELEEENLSLRAKVPRWVPDSEVKAPLQVVPIPLWNGHALCVLTLPALPEAPHD